MAEELRENGVTNLKKIVGSISNPHRRAHLISSIRGLSFNKLDKWPKILTDDPLIPGSCPPKIDHRIAPNLYVSRYPIDPNFPPDEEQ